MSSKPVIVSVALSTLCCIYFARLSDRSEDFFTNTSEKPTPASIQNQSDFSASPEKSFVDSSKKWKATKTVIKVDPTVSSVVYGKKGTRLDFPASVFVDSKGNIVDEQVSITVEECYNVTEMLAAKLSTTSGGKLLETAGMVKLTARVEGEEVTIKDGSFYQISFPKNGNKKDDFKLFYGSWNGEIIDWKLAENPESDDIIYSNTEIEEANKVDETLADNEGNLEVADDEDLKPYKSILGDNEYCFLQICESNFRRGTRISEMDYFNWKLKDGQTLNQWFVSGFNPDLEMLDQYCVLGLRTEITFKVDPSGSFQSYYVSGSAIPEYDRKIVAFLESMPPLDLSQLMPTYTDDHACILTFGSHQGSEPEKFAQDFRKKYAKEPNKPILNADANALEYFIFSSSQLGWINCDRFYDNEGKSVNYTVQNDASNGGTLNLVFDDINSILKGINQGRTVTFYDVPANRNVRLVGIDATREQPLMCVSKGNTNEKNRQLDDYKPFSLSELEAQFRKQ